ncbi:uncharacterized protein N7473_013243 [Penicillium subrubescens]|uniref:uncharacterized protein n=1 Tax=Penicillium subrubescens TaxID=1316194 RepID=UPI00254584EC|nr:uncharacterized protein N7473_013154 [Penicillium subrubescens]XP_057002232.1 uncharacterized protein N7473_013243 [Penicillium subrubescens]KAJ5873595.1 hypothetical protein N7473_013154 [Penicillium subrubescens]KAJ5873684.1 hypothetical protein N7473_013243 [Penicillium subrubescens]
MCLIFITLLAINVLFSRAGPTITQSDCQLDWNLCTVSNDGGMSCYCDGSKQQQAYIHLTHCFANDNGQLTPRVNGGFLSNRDGIKGSCDMGEAAPRPPMLQATCKPNNQLTSTDMGIESYIVQRGSCGQRAEDYNAATRSHFSFGLAVLAVRLVLRAEDATTSIDIARRTETAEHVNYADATIDIAKRVNQTSFFADIA